MDTGTSLMIHIACVVIGVVSAVVAAWQARRAAVAAQSGDVGELAKHVERIARLQRSDTMRRVRAAAPNAEATATAWAPPELVPATLPTTKADLRRRLLRGEPT